MTVDPATGRIYWAEFCEIPGATCGTIRGADLADVPGTAETLVAGEAGPSGVALDPAAGKIYWTNQSPARDPPGLGAARKPRRIKSGERGRQPGQPDRGGDQRRQDLLDATSAPERSGAANLADVSGTTTTLFSGENGPAG